MGRRWAAGIGAALAVALGAPAAAQAVTYTVDTSVDTTAGNCLDATPNDCPLRRAVTIANGTMADDVIVLTTDVQLNLAGAEENLNASGDIDVGGSSALTIRSGSTMRRIDKSGVAGNIRILDVSTPLTLENVEITGGNHTAQPAVGGGGIHFAGFDPADTLRLDNVWVHDNAVGAGAVEAVGGGISASGAGAVEIVGGSRIEDNFAANAIAGSLGLGGGIAVYNGMDLTVADSTIEGNRAGSGGGPNGGRGGGIYFFNSQAATPSLVVTNSEITGNRSGSLGSAGSLYFGGGIYAEAFGAGSGIDASMTGGSLSGNFAGGGSGNSQGQGGGIYASTGGGAVNGELALDGVTVSGNRAGGFDGAGNPSTNDGSRGFGGGVSTNVDTTITGSAIEDNLAGVSPPTPGVNLTGVGAGIYATGSSLNPDLTISGTRVNRNLAGNGNGSSSAGAGILSSSTGGFVLSGSTVEGNATKGFGGGIKREALTASPTADSVTSSSISDNTAGAGAGIDVDTPRTFLVDRSLVSGNTANGFVGVGGGIKASSSGPAPAGRLELRNSTVTGNSSGDPGAGSFQALGGGVALGFSARIDFTAVFSTIASNTVNTGNVNLPFPNYGRGGNIGYVNGTPGATPTVNLTGTIVSGGVANGPGATAPNCAQADATFNSLDGNLEGLDSGGAATNSCGFAGDSDRTGVNPLLGPLADNGGPTRTRALPPGSPAVNAVPSAVCAGATVDQRGFARPYPAGGACDSGAYELGDRDGDGVIDPSDACPTQPGPASNSGCPETVITPPPPPKPVCPKGKVLKKVKPKKGKGKPKLKCVKKRKKKK